MTRLPFIAGVITPLLIGSFFFVLSFSGLYGDEVIHYDQITRFARGDLSLNATLTTLPGYHALLGLMGYVTGVTSISFMRFLSFLIGLATIGVFWLITHDLYGDAGFLRVLQFAFFPILFPFFFLLYTDVLSLLFVLLAFFLMLRERFALAAVMGLAGVLVRQTNIIWALFFFAFLIHVLMAFPLIGTLLRRMHGVHGSSSSG